MPAGSKPYSDPFRGVRGSNGRGDIRRHHDSLIALSRAPFMPLLANIPELVGFFSYSRRDDERAAGALSALRKRIHDELGLQLGRDFRLWQDVAAIPHGTLWEDEIKRAIAESVFFIPIITPAAIGSDHCRFEFDSFLRREEMLGRQNLVFPLLYIRVPELEDKQQRDANPLLRNVSARQHFDWQKFRLRDLNSPEVAEQIELFCFNIVSALRQPWMSPEERARLDDEARLRQQQVEAEARANEEQRREQARRDARVREEKLAREEAAAHARQEEERQARERERAEAKARENERLVREQADREKEQERIAQKEKKAAAASAIGAVQGRRAEIGARIQGGQWAVIWICAFGFLFCGIYLQAAAYVIAPLVNEWHVDRVTVGSLFTWGVFGLFIGSIVGGYLGDAIGRKKAFAVFTLLYSVLAIAGGLTVDFTTFSLSRFIASIGLGAIIPISVSWLIECLTTRHRIPLIGALVACLPMGALVAWAGSQILIPNFGWRSLFLMGWMPAIVGLLAFLAPESPIWLFRQGRTDRAFAALQKLRIDPRAYEMGEARSGRRRNWAALFSSARIRATIVIPLLFLLATTFTSGIGTSLPALISARGLATQGMSSYPWVAGIGGASGTLLLAVLMDSWGLRRAFMLYWVMASICAGLLAFTSSAGSTMPLLFGVTFFGSGTLNCLPIVAAELYPAELRSSAIGLGLALSRAGGVLSPLAATSVISMTGSIMGFLPLLAIIPIVCALMATQLRLPPDA